jgi:hypothetical protein
MNIEVMKQTLEALEGLKSLYGGNRHELHEINTIHRNHDTALTSLRQAIEQAEKQESIQLPAPVFKTVADGIEIGHDLLGGASIRLGGEFVYVHINYDHRYTYNSARDKLAESIVKLLTGTPQSKQEPVAWVHTEELDELRDCNGMSLWAENAGIHTEDSISKQLMPHGYVPLYTFPPQRQQEPVAWLVEFENGEQELHFDKQSVGETHTPLYTHLPQRQWVGLTDEEYKVIHSKNYNYDELAHAIEANLKEKNL